MRICKCIGSYRGDDCEKSLVAALPVTMIARFEITVQLTNKTYLSELANKESSEYEQLKTEVVNALTIIFDEKLGVGKYEITDVTFSDGSVVVNYAVTVPKDNASVVDDVVTAIKESNGTFAGSKFRVPGLKYTESLNDNTSDDYKALEADVRTELQRIYNNGEQVDLKFFAVTDITFTKGSVIVDFSLWVDETIKDKDVLKKILLDFKIRGFDVDRNSIRMSGPVFPWLPVVLGTILSVVLLVLVVILVIFTVRKFREAKLRRWESSDDEDDVNKHYSPTATKQQRLWQERTPTMPPVDPAALQRERYDRQRLNVISRAMSKVANIDWSVMRNFAQRNPGQQGDMLHRSAPARRGNDVWSWDQAK
ncbi:hypothetical protein LSAT2_029447 [Lamellibrachia satsuma]|nr:hypothetical protein LSAT2_029447 [Lamellibrachia satsuma]